MIEKKTIDLSEERHLLIQMIVNTSLLSQLKGIAEARLFESSLSKTIVQWIWEFFDHTQLAPGKAIQDIFLKKQKEIQDEDERELIADFLTRLSEDWEKTNVHNVPYAMKTALEFLKVRSLASLKNDLERAIQANDATAGELMVAEYKKVEKLTGTGVTILKDTKAIIHAFSYDDEHLFRFPGDLGQAVGDFNRGDFVGFMGAPKKGKTHYLWFTAYRALLSGMKTVFVSLEMTEKEMLRMIWQGIEGKPEKTKKVVVPSFIPGPNDKDNVRTVEETRTAVNLTIVKDRQNFYKKYLRGGDLKLLTFPSTGTTFGHIKNELTNLEYYENWVPDVLVVDYADLLEPMRKGEYRHGLDEIWRTLRGFAQEKYIMVATASQAGRKGLDHDIKSGDVSEDVRKMAHVTKMMMLNQNDREYEDGIIRIKTGVQRHGKRSTQQVIVLQCYEIGRPYMDSRFKNRVNYDRYEDKDKKFNND